MQNNQFSNSVNETITAVNRGSGISNNMMAYRLLWLMSQQPQQAQLVQVAPLDQSDRSSVENELRAVLSHSTQNTENYRQVLKNKYYIEYLEKLGVQSTVAKENSNRVENLIAQKKRTFIQDMLKSGERLPLGQKINAELIQTKDNTTKPAVEAVEAKQEQSSKKSLIDSVIRTIVTMGKDTSDQGRVYEGIVYRLQLLMKEGIQQISVHRKSGTPSSAFTAKKQDNQEFQIIQDNLSPQEVARLIAFDKQQLQQRPQAEYDLDDENKNKKTELGD